MPSTSLGFPYPSLTDVPNGPAQTQALASAVDNYLTAANADSGWIPITIGGSYQAAPSSPTIAVRLRRGVPYYRGQIQRVTGSFPASSAIAIWVAGAIPANCYPPAGYNRQLSAQDASSSVRGLIGADGSFTIATGTSVPVYFDISGMSGYLPVGV